MNFWRITTCRLRHYHHVNKLNLINENESNYYMKKALVLLVLFSIMFHKNNAQVNHLPLLQMSSPKKQISITLYAVDSFALYKEYSYSDYGESKILFNGKYYYRNDTLFFSAKNNIFKIKKETDEIYSVIGKIYTQTDTVCTGDKFFTRVYYPNGQVKQSGGWTNDGLREGVWIYYDSSGFEIRKRAFKNGVLINDNYEWGKTRQKITRVNAPVKQPLLELSSSKRPIYLALYKDSFTLSQYSSCDELIEQKIFFSGKTYYTGDTLILKARNNYVFSVFSLLRFGEPESKDTVFLKERNNITFKFKKENHETYSLITPIYTNNDTLRYNDKFYVDRTYYPNGERKILGGMWFNGLKRDIWSYYDSTGTAGRKYPIRKRLYKFGLLEDDDYKWNWEAEASTKPLVKMSSLRAGLELRLYTDTFTLSKASYFDDDGMPTKRVVLFGGEYNYLNDTLILKTGNRIIKLKKEADEIYSLLTPLYIGSDSLNVNDKFLTNIIYHPNGKIKILGGWLNDVKDDIWLWYYYDSTGNLTRKKAFKNGALINDNYKWDWEK